MDPLKQAISLLVTAFFSFATGSVVIFFISIFAISYMKAKEVTRKELNKKKAIIHLLSFIAFSAWLMYTLVAKFQNLSLIITAAAITGIFIVTNNAIQQKEKDNQEPIIKPLKPRQPGPSKENSSQKEIGQPYKRRYKDKFHLMNKTETELMNRLLLAVPAYNVFPQVSMSQFFHMESEDLDTKRKLIEIGKKNVDFVLCRKNDSSIVMAVEFNGPFHNDPIRQASDRTKRKALEEAGIPLLVYTSIPDKETLKTDIVHLVRERLKNEQERNQRIQQSKSSKQANVAKLQN